MLSHRKFPEWSHQYQIGSQSQWPPVLILGMDVIYMPCSTWSVNIPHSVQNCDTELSIPRDCGVSGILILMLYFQCGVVALI